jgi:polysaccharide export outer membrane protein
MSARIWQGSWRVSAVLALFCLLLAAIGCGERDAASSGSATSNPPVERPVYRLGSGDKLHVTVFDEPSLSGDFDVSDRGTLALPLADEVNVGGKTTKEAEALIAAKYSEHYLVNPRVSVGVVNYRPFFIVGEVKNPGSYPYVAGMTVLNAVALAGGYTPRADHSDILIKRSADAAAPEATIGEFGAVMPGDIVRVKGRFF